MANSSLQLDTVRQYIEYGDAGYRRRDILVRNETNRQVRTDRIGSRSARWKARTYLDYNFAHAMRKQNNEARADALWESNPRSMIRDPYANVVGWYMGKIDKQSWIKRPVPAHRRIRPAKLMPKGRSARHDAYFKVKAEREAREDGRGDILTPAEQGWLRGRTNLKIRSGESEEVSKRRKREAELKKILASLNGAGQPPQEGVSTDPRGSKTPKQTVSGRSGSGLQTPLDTSDDSET